MLIPFHNGAGKINHVDHLKCPGMENLVKSLGLTTKLKHNNTKYFWEHGEKWEFLFKHDLFFPLKYSMGNMPHSLHFS